jgi:hypothetical protein
MADEKLKIARMMMSATSSVRTLSRVSRTSEDSAQKCTKKARSLLSPKLIRNSCSRPSKPRISRAKHQFDLSQCISVLSMLIIYQMMPPSSKHQAIYSSLGYIQNPRVPTFSPLFSLLLSILFVKHPLYNASLAKYTRLKYYRET